VVDSRERLGAEEVPTHRLLRARVGAVSRRIDLDVAYGSLLAKHQTLCRGRSAPTAAEGAPGEVAAVAFYAGGGETFRAPRGPSDRLAVERSQ
jgi:hypothetical protein